MAPCSAPALGPFSWEQICAQTLYKILQEGELMGSQHGDGDRNQPNRPQRDGDSRQVSWGPGSYAVFPQEVRPPHLHPVQNAQISLFNNKALQ